MIDFKKWSIKKIFKEIIIMVVLVTLFANVISYFKSPDLPTEHLPKIDVTLIDMESFSTDDLNGEPLLIHFWATWCPTCKTEAGNIESISKDFPVLSVAVQSGSDAEIQSFMKERDLGYAVYNDSTGMAKDFSVQAYPTTFIFDSNGELAFTEVGYTSTLGLYLRMWWAGR